MSAGVLKTPQKLVHAIPHDNAKEALRQLRLSLRRREGPNFTTSNSLPSSAESQPDITVPDEHPSPNAETALVPMKPIASQEDLQPTIKMAQLTPIENRQATDNGSASPVQAEEMNEAKAANAFSFPEIEDTPTVRVRPKQGTRKRKTEPSV